MALETMVQKRKVGYLGSPKRPKRPKTRKAIKRTEKDKQQNRHDRDTKGVKVQNKREMDIRQRRLCPSPSI